MESNNENDNENLNLTEIDPDSVPNPSFQESDYEEEELDRQVFCSVAEFERNIDTFLSYFDDKCTTPISEEENYSSSFEESQYQCKHLEPVLETPVDFEGNGLDFVMGHEELTADKVRSMLVGDHLRKVLIKENSKSDYCRFQIGGGSKKDSLPMEIVGDCVRWKKCLDTITSSDFVRYYNSRWMGPVSDISISEMYKMYKNQSPYISKGIVLMEPINLLKPNRRFPEELPNTWEKTLWPISIKPDHLVLFVAIRDDGLDILDSDGSFESDIKKYAKVNFSQKVQQKLKCVRFKKDCPQQNPYSMDCVLYVIYNILQMCQEPSDWSMCATQDEKINYLRGLCYEIMEFTNK